MHPSTFGKDNDMTRVTRRSTGRLPRHEAKRRYRRKNTVGDGMRGRRAFLRTSAGFVASALGPGVWAVAEPTSSKRPFPFRPYRPEKTFGKVLCVTPDDGFYLQTFYDVCPFSPSGRYLAVTRLPFQDRQPKLGDTADVCVVDLQSRTIETVYTTKGWAFQLGANLNWGRTDQHLYTNDVLGGCGVAVRIDRETGETRAFAGPMYHIAPDESAVIGFPPRYLNSTQFGYGIPVDWRNVPRLAHRASADEGLWKTDLQTNERRLLVSIADLYKQLPDGQSLGDVICYLFHSKFNRPNTRIMQVFRATPRNDGRQKLAVFTFKVDGSDIKLAIDHRLWSKGGHHPNWHPDGEHLIMNLRPHGNKLLFCQYQYDGSEFHVISEKHPGGGHPSVTADGHYLVTDAYVNEGVVLPDKEVPIRLLDTRSDEVEVICNMYTLGREGDLGRGILRLDPHPAWSRDYEKVCFNGAPEGRRQVFVADLSDKL